MGINFFNTFIHKEANKYINEVLTNSFLSEGRLVKEFEQKLNQEFNILNPVAVNSGTTALHLALILAGVTEGDEVILPAQTFVSTGLVILQQKATPVFADINYDDGNISPISIRTKITNKTKAIIVVHWAGYPCDMDEISSIAKEYNIPVIEDAAHALGAKYKGEYIGAISDFTCFSFQAIKHLTTGDGGLVACKSNDKTNEAFKRRWFGIDRANSEPSILGERSFQLNVLGFKYHMNDYCAALGLANLLDFNLRYKYRSEIVQYYDQELKDFDGISLFNKSLDRFSANWLYGFHVHDREKFIRHMKKANIPVSVVHQRIDKYEIFKGETEGLYNQEKFDKTQIHIPIHDAITKENSNYIIEQIKKGW
jgi:perosamine synthetase